MFLLNDFNHLDHFEHMKKSARFMINDNLITNMYPPGHLPIINIGSEGSCPSGNKKNIYTYIFS